MDFLVSILDVSRQISQGMVGEDVMQAACQRLAEALDLHYVAVIRPDSGASADAALADHMARPASSSPDLPDGLFERFELDPTPFVAPPDGDSGPSQAGPESGPLIAFPLLLGGAVVGALLLVAAGKDRVFGAEETQALQLLAAQLALGLRNTELAQANQRHANQLEKSANFGRLVTSTFDQDKILRHVADVVPSLLPVDQVSVTFYAASQSQIRHLVLSLDAPVEERLLSVAGSGVEQVVQTQSPLSVDDLQISTYTDHRRLVDQGLRSLLAMPLAVGGRVLGTLNIASRRTGAYSPAELILLEQLGNQVAIALENARQFQRAQHRATYEEALSQITSQLQQQTDLRNILQQTLQDLGRVLGARQARVRLQIQGKPERDSVPQSRE